MQKNNYLCKLVFICVIKILNNMSEKQQKTRSSFIKSHTAGYLLGLLLFVIGIPALMWRISGRGLHYLPDSAALWITALLLCLSGLTLSICTIVYMRTVGQGNPFDAYGHEIAPRTQNLMTRGPYRICRNPMLLGIYIYDAGVLLFLWSWLPLLVFAVEVLLLSLQVRSEEKRLKADFGETYLHYQQQVGRYLPFRLKKKK